jgi:predicted transcriptional regulator
MTDLLDRALDAVRRMPPAEQDSIAEAMLSLAGIGRPLDIEPEHRAAVMEGRAQAARGEFVEGDVQAIVARAFARARE